MPSGEPKMERSRDCCSMAAEMVRVTRKVRELEEETSKGEPSPED